MIYHQGPTPSHPRIAIVCCARRKDDGYILSDGNSGGLITLFGLTRIVGGERLPKAISNFCFNELLFISIALKLLQILNKFDGNLIFLTKRGSNGTTPILGKFMQSDLGPSPRKPDSPQPSQQPIND
jgi:hypothetical protein